MSTTRAGIYCRISRDAEDEGLGVQRQEQDCRTLAARLGLEAVEVFIDNDISASTRSTKRRPRYEDMLSSAERGDLDVVLAYSTSRLTRRPMEYERLITLVEKRGTRIETVVSGRVDLTTADGRFIARTLANADAAEAERTAERVKRAALGRAEKGEWHGGHVPYGYRQSGKGRLLVVPSEAAVLREIADRYLKGETRYGLVSDLNRREVLTSKGRPWSSRTLDRVLSSPSIAGLRKTADGRLVEGSWEPILERTIWERLCAKMQHPDRIASGKQGEYTGARKFALSGLLKCGLCGKTMYSQPYMGKPSFICQDQASVAGRKLRIGYDDLEQFVSRLVFDALDSPQVASAMQTEESGDEAVRQLSDELAADREMLARLLDDYADGLLSREELKRQQTRLRQRVEDNQRAMERLTARPVLRDVPTGDEARRLWEERDVTWRRTLLSALIEKVVIGPFPKGAPMRPAEAWEDRARLLAQRVEIVWLA